MRITSADVQFHAQHASFSERSRHESLTLWQGDERLEYRREEHAVQGHWGQEALLSSLRSGRLPPGIPNAAARQAANRGRADTPIQDWVKLSDEAQALGPRRKGASLDKLHMSASHELEVHIISEMVRRITGHDLQLLDPADLALDEEQQAAGARAREAGQALEQASSESRQRDGALEGWGVVYDHYERYHEVETTAFSAEGVIRTADGKEIDFSAQLNMSREYLEVSRTTVRMGDAVRMKDPLVVNFGGKAAELTTERFRFDLDADGRAEQVAVLAPGSAYLAHDRNGDGTINDGSELFGAVTGDGFGELARHDTDRNGWIDEGDEIYRGLRLWSSDADGNTRLIGLGQAGIGAIYLGHVATPFALKESDNSTLGMVRESGIWVGESGDIGTVQKLDLVV